MEKTTEHTEHTEKALHVGIYHAGPFLQPQAGSFTQGVGQQERRSRIPMSGAAGCAVTLPLFTPPLP